MKILIVDNEALTAQLIQSRMEPLGHQVTAEPSKNKAADRVKSGEYGIILLDPSPLTSPRPLIADIRRQAGNYPYIVILSETIEEEVATQLGGNDLLKKPIDLEKLDEKVENAKHFAKLVKRITDDSEDFPSAGGIIAKSAFNQLFLSAIDRADRYGENTYLLFISLENYNEIYTANGPYAADYAVAKLSQFLVKIRRQSDIIGQTANNEYCLLLQRPLYETEPMEATQRFMEAIMGFEGFASLEAESIRIRTTLTQIPLGRRLIDQIFEPGQQAAA
ncbi:MAG: response regulator [Alphaproteobacteria bacterium]|nr:response regulator [Alphaproteobacteria bacterium]